MTALHPGLDDGVAQRLVRAIGGRESPVYKHRVYIGGFHPHPDVMFVKVGMTSNVQSRIKQYSGMVPGGLDSMYTATVPTRSDALRAEKSILCALSKTDNFKAIGGEWFSCAPTAFREALAELEQTGGNISQARIARPTPFAGGKRGKRPHRRAR